jgi:DNA repair exonuclease SbcCD ATPase subunit
MESAAKAHERELKGLNKLLSSAQSSVEKLTKKIEKSEEDNAGLAERVKELGKELERMAGANSQLEMEAKELQEEVETLKKGIDKAQKQITGLEKANGELTDANKELTGSLKQTQKDAAKAEKAFEKLQGEKDALETVVAEQAEAIEASEEARLDASSRLDAAEAASAKLKVSILSSEVTFNQSITPFVSSPCKYPRICPVLVPKPLPTHFTACFFVTLCRH